MIFLYPIFKSWNYKIMHIYVNAVYPSYCDTTVALYMHAYELIRSV